LGKEGVEKKAGLGPVIFVECWANVANEVSRDVPLWRGEKASALLLGCLLWRTAIKRVGAVSSLIRVDVHLACAVTVVVVDCDMRLIDRKLLEINIAVAVDLCIEIGEDTALEQGIIAEVDTTNNMAWLKL